MTSQDMLDVGAGSSLGHAHDWLGCRVGRVFLPRSDFQRRADACQILPEGTATPAIDQTDRRYRALSPDRLMTAIHAACPQLMLWTAPPPALMSHRIGALASGSRFAGARGHQMEAVTVIGLDMQSRFFRSMASTRGAGNNMPPTEAHYLLPFFQGCVPCRH